ncbi:MAG: hypothetical protein QOJ64_888 [Acidobacteriota bacterium]|nr:hypothetical protein [Acidobacteriota bacterium]
MKHRSRHISPLLLVLLALTIGEIVASAQSPFRGTFKGSYELPGAVAKVKVTATLRPVGRTVKVRWVSIDTLKGATEPEDPAEANLIGRVEGGRLRFLIPEESNPYEGTSYVATMQGSTLVVRFVLYYDPQGGYSYKPCEGCKKTNQVVRMKRQ